MQSLEAMHVSYPTQTHYECALFLDALRWTAPLSDNEMVCIEKALVMLTSSKYDAKRLLVATLQALDTVYKLEQATTCDDPNCPIHGNKPAPVAPAPLDPNSLDTAFGIGEYDIENGG